MARRSSSAVTLSDLGSPCRMCVAAFKVATGKALFDLRKHQVALFGTIGVVAVEKALGFLQPTASPAVFAAENECQSDPEPATRRTQGLAVLAVIIESPFEGLNELRLAPQHVGGFPEPLQAGAAQLAVPIFGRKRAIRRRPFAALCHSFGIMQAHLHEYQTSPAAAQGLRAILCPPGISSLRKPHPPVTS